MTTCDHCGTVTRALTIWTTQQTAGCDCQCHQARRYDATKPARKKKGTK